MICCLTEYGLTEASTGISVGSQPPLVIPSTQLGDTSPYQTPQFQPLFNSTQTPLTRTFSTPCSGFSPRATKKRLSLAGSETTSSVDSSSSSRVYDLNIQTTDEEASLRSCISTPLEEKLSNAVKRNKQRRLSREISPLVQSNITERLEENMALENKEKLCEKRRKSSVEETLGDKDKCDASEDDRKGNTFIKSVPFLGKFSERERSRSTEETVSESPVMSRNLEDKDFNSTAPRRRSFIERISMKSHIDSLTKRRNSLEIPSPRNGKDSDADDSALKDLPSVCGHSTEV